jgi:hypothetical protein
MEDEMSLDVIRKAIEPYKREMKDRDGKIVTAYKPGVRVRMKVKDLADVIPGGLNCDPRTARPTPPGVGNQVLHELVWRICQDKMEWEAKMNNPETTDEDKAALRKKAPANGGIATEMKVDIKTLELILSCAQPAAQPQERLETLSVPTMMTQGA